MAYAIYVALGLVAFLVHTNGYLKGAKKAQIDAVLGGLLLGLVIASFIIGGWKFGLLAIAVPFLTMRLDRPLAVRTAAKLLSLHSPRRCRYVGLPPRRLEKISRELARLSDGLLGATFGGDMRLAVESASHCRDVERVLLDYVQSQAAI